MEIWKAIPGYEGLYEASSFGRVRSLDRRAGKLRKKLCSGRIISPSPTGVGYMSFALCRDNKKTRLSVHRAVCMAFHGQPPPMSDARHLNGDRSDNRPLNLRWGSRRDNEADKAAHGRNVFGEKVPNAKLTAPQVREIRRRRASGEKQRVLAMDYGVNQSAISEACSGVTWGHVR